MINKFESEYRFLSNSYPCHIDHEGVVYPSPEHAYQAAKTLNLDFRKTISNCQDPARAKKMGRSLRLREDWHDIKIDVMDEILRIKFDKEPFRTLLIETNPHELVKGNTWGDTFWGVCDGVGENHLGKLLMKLRKQIIGAMV